MRHAPGKNTPFAKYCTVVIVCRHGKPAFLPAVGAFCFTLLQLSVTDVTEVSILYIFKADYPFSINFFCTSIRTNLKMAIPIESMGRFRRKFEDGKQVSFSFDHIKASLSQCAPTHVK